MMFKNQVVFICDGVPDKDGEAALIEDVSVPAKGVPMAEQLLDMERAFHAAGIVTERMNSRQSSGAESLGGRLPRRGCQLPSYSIQPSSTPPALRPCRG